MYPALILYRSNTIKMLHSLFSADHVNITAVNDLIRLATESILILHVLSIHQWPPLCASRCVIATAQTLGWGSLIGLHYHYRYIWHGYHLSSLQSWHTVKIPVKGRFYCLSVRMNDWMKSIPRTIILFRSKVIYHRNRLCLKYIASNCKRICLVCYPSIY